MSSVASPVSLDAETLISWNDMTAQRWRSLLQSHPEALAIPCDIYKTSHTVLDLLHHLIGAELRYAQRAAGVPETASEALPLEVEAIFDAHDQAIALYRASLADISIDWQREIEFNTLTIGRVKAKRKDVLLHGLLHSIRHYAQLATLVRSHGIKSDWPMDYLFVVAGHA
jgi:uncharacterized damage-inducible protein DinB